LVNGANDELGAGDALGEFRILDRLGEGGMGVVYLARDERLDRRIALKVIAPRLASDIEFRERFVAEARSAAAIDHPHAVPIYSAGVADDRPYIAMRYIAGTDLRNVLTQFGPLSPVIATTVVSEIASALDAAHASGMVHRDVKPANILLEGDPGHGSSYLTDFGLTKGRDANAQLTGTGQWVGTIDYVAPEQIQAGRIDARTDVYALGCVLYEALTGSVPFAGSDMQKMWGHVNGPFPVLEPANEWRALGEVIARATAKDPDDRFPSAGDFARAANAAVAGGRVETPERSVATGSAANGLDEAGMGVGASPTVTGRAPAPGLRDMPTTRMPSPESNHPRRPNGNLRTAAIIGASLVFAAGLVAAAVVMSSGSSNSKQASTSRKLHQESTTDRIKSQPTLPPNVEPCSATVYVKERVAGRPYTSCPFALEVERAYARGGESAQISAYSPVTRKLYRMSCGGFNPITCSGGTGALVYLTSSTPSAPEPPQGQSESDADLGDWPGGNGYSAMLGAFTVEEHARARQSEAVERGLEAGVLYSSNFSSLTPGYWVVFSGSFRSIEEAAARASEAQSMGFTDSYPKLVAP